jgi:hypothetical protein
MQTMILNAFEVFTCGLSKIKAAVQRTNLFGHAGADARFLAFELKPKTESSAAGAPVHRSLGEGGSWP